MPERLPLLMLLDECSCWRGVGAIAVATVLLLCEGTGGRPALAVVGVAACFAAFAAVGAAFLAGVAFTFAFPAGVGVAFPAAPPSRPPRVAAAAGSVFSSRRPNARLGGAPDGALSLTEKLGLGATVALR